MNGAKDERFKLLIETLEGSVDVNKRIAAIKELRRFGSCGLRELIKTLNDPDPLIRLAVIEELCKIRDSQAVLAIKNTADSDPDEYIRKKARYIFERCKNILSVIEEVADIHIRMPKKEFKQGVWDTVLLEISNIGNVEVKELSVEFSEEVKVKDLETIKVLKCGESRTLEFLLKPVDIGIVPVDVKLLFKDVNNKNYTKIKRFYLNVVSVFPSIEKIESLELLKDEISKLTNIKNFKHLEAKYSREDIVKILEAFKIIDKIRGMTFEDYPISIYAEQLELLKKFIEDFDGDLIVDLDLAIKHMLVELMPDKIPPENSKEKIRRICQHLVDIWIAKFLR